MNGIEKIFGVIYNMKRRNQEENTYEQLQSQSKYKIVKLQYSYQGTTPKTHITYERNGIKKDIELNGLLDEATVMHVLAKRGF